MLKKKRDFKKNERQKRTIHVSYRRDRLDVFEVLEIHSYAGNLFLIYSDTWHWEDAFRNPGMMLSKSLSPEINQKTEWDWFFFFFFKLSFHWKWILANALGKLEDYGTFCPRKLCRKWWKTTRSHSHMNFKNGAKKLAFNTGLCDGVSYWTDRRRVYSAGRHAILIDVTHSIWADSRRRADIAFVICYPGCHNKQNLTHTHTRTKKERKKREKIFHLLFPNEMAI